MFQRVARVLATVLLLSGASLASAGVTRDDFAFPKSGTVRIVVFRPDVRVGSLRVGGLDEPNADWTAAARTNLQTSLEGAAETRDSAMTFLGDLEGENGALLAEYRGLFEAVSQAIVQHQFLADRLPTKLAASPDPKARKRYRLDWSLGPDTRRLKAATGADYAMFIFTHDSYGDAGRKVAQMLMAGLFGAYMPAGIHIGYAGMVDLETGDVVWFNTDLAMGGDVREPDGADKRVRQLLAGLPTRQAAAVAPAAPAAARN